MKYLLSPWKMRKLNKKLKHFIPNLLIPLVLNTNEADISKRALILCCTFLYLCFFFHMFRSLESWLLALGKCITYQGNNFVLYNASTFQIVFFFFLDRDLVVLLWMVDSWTSNKRTMPKILSQLTKSVSVQRVSGIPVHTFIPLSLLKLLLVICLLYTILHIR